MIAAVMGLSVAAMHYTAMQAASFYSLGAGMGEGHQSSSTHIIAIIVAAFVLLIMSATILCSIVDARLQSAELSVQARITREQDIVNNLADGLIIFDEKGLVESLNYKSWEMFESQHSDNNKFNIQQLMPSFDLSKLNEYLTASTSNRNAISIDAQTEGGKIFPVEISISPMSTLSGDNRLYNCIVRDISKRIELESQLRQAQKLESIGHLTAGIAHEINTPTQYVSDNTAFLKDAFQNCFASLSEIKELTKSYNQSSNLGNKLDFEEIWSKHDLEFMSQEVPLAIGQSLEGLQRISHIVGAMKSFSHSNHDEKLMVDINEAIESTITVARGEWRYVAAVETNFSNDLPAISCYRDPFNQVILNIIINAAHAIKDKHGDAGQGLIKISTRAEEPWLIIEIEDNGSGMPKEVSERIFDPFFTTKEVGKGTGQGLSIAYSVVVEQHNGFIEVDSQHNEGTTFTIKLPLSNLSSAEQQGDHSEHSVG
ncbi:PAS domain S-box protein [Vibrio sp. ZSDE26]|uniref:histidine kinase n=1 Tax=Vibrio amylolyticus TaxID=2847292 RepID=A0A9X1XLE4_9VIBR|nr:ATP-binding protein [Vibrio amylolyticus]MCK6264048.1 PAS domain S-box protein [Vibrio amylolyticus]